MSSSRRSKKTTKTNAYKAANTSNGASPTGSAVQHHAVHAAITEDVKDPAMTSSSITNPVAPAGAAKVSPDPDKPINPLVSGKGGMNEVSQPPSGIRYKTADSGNRFSTGGGFEFDTESVKASDLTKDHAFLCACGLIHSHMNAIQQRGAGKKVAVNSSHGHSFDPDKDITVIKGDLDRETRKKINKYPWEAI